MPRSCVSVQLCMYLRKRIYRSCFVAMITIEFSNNAGTPKWDSVCLVLEKHHFQLKKKKKEEWSTSVWFISFIQMNTLNLYTCIITLVVDVRCNNGSEPVHLWRLMENLWAETIFSHRLDVRMLTSLPHGVGIKSASYHLLIFYFPKLHHRLCSIWV